MAAGAAVVGWGGLLYGRRQHGAQQHLNEWLQWRRVRSRPP